MFTGEATPNLGLPQWEGGDHPEWLTDMNPAFKKIDESIGELTGTANEANKLIKEIIPIVTENTERITSLDTREESDRAYLQQQVDALKNADTFIHGILDAMQIVDGELKDSVKDLDRRLKEEEGTTAGFSSAAGNTVMDYYNRLKTSLENHVVDYTKLVTDFQQHVDDWDSKYTDLNQRLTDAEQNMLVLDNRITALEDWKSPFAQQVAELEERFGVVNSDFVNLKKSFAILQDNVNELDTAVHQLESGQVLQDAEIERIKTQIGEINGSVNDSTQNIEQLINQLADVDDRISTIEGNIDNVDGSLNQLQSSLNNTEEAVAGLQESSEETKEQLDNFSEIIIRLAKIYAIESEPIYAYGKQGYGGVNVFEYRNFTTEAEMYTDIVTEFENYVKQANTQQLASTYTLTAFYCPLIELCVDNLDRIVSFSSVCAHVFYHYVSSILPGLHRYVPSKLASINNDLQTKGDIKKVNEIIRANSPVSYKLAIDAAVNGSGIRNSFVTESGVSITNVLNFSTDSWIRLSATVEDKVGSSLTLNLFTSPSETISNGVIFHATSSGEDAIITRL